MVTGTLKRRKTKKGITIVQDYDIAADAKNRISLREAKSKYFNMKALPNGCYVLQLRMLVAPEAIPQRTLKMLERSGFGKGPIFLGGATIITNSNGNDGFTVTLPGAVPAGHFISATATGPNGAEVSRAVESEY